MNLRILSSALYASSILFCATTSATVTINLGLGQLTTSESVNLPNGTLWALIAQDSSGNLPGGLLQDSSLYSNNNSQTIINDFGGATISAGNLVGGGYIIDTGSTFSDGFIDAAINDFDFIAAGLSQGDKLGVYWFPGLTTASNTLPATSFEIGGLNRVNANSPSGGNAGLVIPADGTSVDVGYFDNNVTEGASGIPKTEFQAIAVPEPSALLFLGTSFLFLLRRRRR